MIIHQDDYSMTRMINCKGCRHCGDLPATRNDAKVAKAIANGFGILDEDIVNIYNKNFKEINLILNDIKRVFKALSEAGKRTFLYVYAAGHGCADQMQHMILNATSANLFPIEQTCRDFCEITKDLCTVFAQYDMCKDEKSNYPGLTLAVEKKIVDKGPKA